MEALQQSITLDLKNMIMSSVSSNLSSSCAALDLHFSSLPLFQQLLEQLVNPCQSSCAKDSSVALKSKLEGNAALKFMNYEKAISSYTKALRYAPFTSKEEDKLFLAAAFVNRAVALHKLGLLEPATRDCGRAIDIYPFYSKAWFRRSRIKFDMRRLEEALSDMKEALALERTNSGRKQIENEIAMIEVKLKCRSPPSENISHVPAESKTTQRASPPEVDFLHLHWSDDRGFDLRTNKELEVGSLVFEEEAYAAIVLKPNRDTHCHFCFEMLPADPVACCGCAIPLYCSSICRLYATAGSRTSSLKLGGNGEPEENIPEHSANEWDGEHTHECGGYTWPAVLPTEAVLAARTFFRNAVTSKVLDKEVQIGEEGPSYKEGKAMKVTQLKGTCKVETLCSNYERLSSDDKLEIHVLGVTLAYCVQRAAKAYMKGGSKVTAKVAAKLIHLIAQTRVNTMAIYCMSSPVSNINSADTGRDPTTNTVFSAVEQVKVAQGLYLLGSRLNHSCVPNIHASFKLRRLLLHSVSSIPAGSPLQLCYGPQVGHMTQVERRRFLQERYYFECKCSACARVTSSDLFLRSFRCVKQGCMGVVLSPDLNGVHVPFSKSPASCSSISAVETFREGRVGCSSASSVEPQGACFSGGCNNVMGETYFPANKDSESGHTDSPHELAVPNICSTGSEMSRKLTGKDMVGRCLECGRPVDVDSAHEAATTAFTRLERIESKMLTPEAPVDSLRHLQEGALDALDKLRTVLHAYNEQLAKGEDIVARLFCALDQPLDGLKHCEKAVQILEQLYGKHHIVLGNEYLKLASVAIIVPDLECARRNLRNADYIFRIHYGSDYRETLPYITELHHLVHQE